MLLTCKPNRSRRRENLESQESVHATSVALRDVIRYNRGTAFSPTPTRGVGEKAVPRLMGTIWPNQV
jgi:hypothetical protein